MADQPCILLVEDEVLLRELLVTHFEDAGILVVPVESAEAALGILESDRRIDVLFTDIKLPGAMDGWRLAEHARTKRPHIRVIYVTGYTAERRAQLPNTIYISKPFRPSLVIEQVRRWAEADVASG